MFNKFKNYELFQQLKEKNVFKKIILLHVCIANYVLKVLIAKHVFVIAIVRKLYFLKTSSVTVQMPFYRQSSHGPIQANPERMRIKISMEFIKMVQSVFSISIRFYICFAIGG